MKAHYPGFYKSVSKTRFGAYFIVREEWENRARYATTGNRTGELWSELVRREQVLGQDLQQEHAGAGQQEIQSGSNANLGAAASS